MTISCIVSGPRSDSSPVLVVPRQRLPKRRRKRSLHPKLGPAQQWSVVRMRPGPEGRPDIDAVAIASKRVAFSVEAPVRGQPLGRPHGPNAQDLAPIAPQLQVEEGGVSDKCPVDKRRRVVERAEGGLEDPARTPFYFCPGRRILRAVDASEPVFEPRVVRNGVVEKRRSLLPGRKEPPRRGANLPPPDQDALVVDIGGVAPGKTHPPVTEARPELPNLARRRRVDHPAEARNADISDRIRRLHGEEVAAVPSCV